MVRVRVLWYGYIGEKISRGGKAYDSEEITTKAGKKSACQTMLYICSCKSGKSWRTRTGAKSNGEKTAFYATAGLGDAAQLGVGDVILEMALGTFQVPPTRRVPALAASRGEALEGCTRGGVDAGVGCIGVGDDKGT